jgi:predicted heme/steroid binding protein
MVTWGTATRIILRLSKVIKRFSKGELARCNGKNGAPAYITYKEKVYDVSTSFQWRNGNGRHQVLHNAGEDLTESLEQAPHNAELLQRFPVIGILR